MDHPTEEKKQALYSACKHFICIDLMEFQRFTNAISETLPPLGVKKIM